MIPATAFAYLKALEDAMAKPPTKKRKVIVIEEDDILDRLRDLHKQATTERSHFYVANCCLDAIDEIIRLRSLAEDPD